MRAEPGLPETDSGRGRAGASPVAPASRPRSFGSRARAALFRRLRPALLEIRFWMLFAWFSVIGPPRMLIYDPALNVRLLRAFGATVGEDVRVLPPLMLNITSDKYRKLTIGEGCILNSNVFLDLTEPVTLGYRTGLGPGAIVLTHNTYNRNDFQESRMAASVGRGPVVVEAGASIKANAMILHGVTIGAEAVVAGGAVVNRSVAARHFVAGVPAQTKRVLE